MATYDYYHGAKTIVMVTYGYYHGSKKLLSWQHVTVETVVMTTILSPQPRKPFAMTA